MINALIVIGLILILAAVVAFSWNGSALAAASPSCRPFQNSAQILQMMEVGSSTSWTTGSQVAYPKLSITRLGVSSWRIDLPINFNRPTNVFGSVSDLMQAVLTTFPGGPNHADGNVLVKFEEGRYGYVCVRLYF